MNGLKKIKKEFRPFDESFKLLEEYSKTNNKLPPHSNPDIGDWLSNQKTAYNNKKISEERKKKMISIPQFLEWIKEQKEDKKENRSFDESFKLFDESFKLFDESFKLFDESFKLFDESFKLFDESCKLL